MSGPSRGKLQQTGMDKLLKWERWLEAELRSITGKRDLKRYAIVIKNFLELTREYMETRAELGYLKRKGGR